MTQFAELSVEAFKIVNKFLDKKEGKEIFSQPDKQLMVSLYSLLPCVNPKVLDILKEHIVTLNEYLTSEEISLLQNEYKAVVTYCYEYSDFNTARGFFGYSGHLHLPSSLVDLCLSVAKPETGKHVYLPYAGEGLFAAYCRGCEIDGFEEDPTAWAISQILATASNSSVAIESRNIDSDQNKKYDYIFSFPPILVPGKWSRQADENIYHIITNQLTENGEFYAILPMSFCNGPRWLKIRKILTDYNEKFSALVIALPPMLEPENRTPICFVSLYKDKRNLVVLANITGEEFFARQDTAGCKDYTLKVQSVLETIQKQDEKYVWVGDASDLVGSLNMAPSRYLYHQVLPVEKKGERYIKIKELIDIVPSFNVKKDSSIQPVIGMKELSFNYLNCNIRYKDLNKRQELYSNRAILEKALLVGFIGGKFKVGRLAEIENNQHVLLGLEVVPFKLKSNLITEDFFLRQIMSEVSEKQGKALSSGSVIKRLREEDLLEIKILVPSLEKQDELCKEDTRKSLTESHRQKIEAYEDFRKDVHMKKHAIGQTLANLRNWWRLLDQVREDGNGIVNEKTVIGRMHKVSVKEIFENLDSAMSKLSIQLNKFDTGYGLKKESIALTEFIEKYIQDNKSPLFKYDYEPADHRSTEDMPEIDLGENQEVHFTGDIVLSKGDPLEYVKFPKDALTSIFNNIVSNACAHGFAGREDDENIIKIEISNVGSDYIVSLSNNGKPLDARMNCNDITVYGNTSGDTRTHFGIGGYEIKRLMEEFGDEVEIVSEPEKEFTVTYKLIFHDTDIIYAL